MLPLDSATRTLAELVEGVRDDQHANPTPCGPMKLGALLDHVNGLSIAFKDAADKAIPEGGSQPPSSDASRLAPDWRTRIPKQLNELAQAWRDEKAWSGMTEVGGVALPGEVAALVAVNEVILHGWDIAVSSGQNTAYPPDAIEAAMQFVSQSAAENPEGTPGLFGAPVAVPDDAPALEKLVGLTGRGPGWRVAE
ncbi:MAG: hypothetical protein JWM76_1854 [Pseudonocardiales bacterium]|nr:hypothetical protein [Pseudonocardiales bacterium]